MKIKRLTICAMMLAIIVILGRLSLPMPGVAAPITLQNLGIMFAGLILKKSEAFTVVTTFLVAAAVGLPVLTNGAGGIDKFFGMTNGYLFSYVIAAFLIAWAMEKTPQPPKFIPTLIVVIIFGVLVIDLVGGGVMALHVPAAGALKVFKGSLAFIPIDLAKAVVVSLVFVALPKTITSKN